MMKFDTIKEAAQEWVNGFNAIPSGILEKLLRNDPEELYEITPPGQYDKVYITDGKHKNEYGTIIRRSKSDENKYQIELDTSKKRVTLHKDDFEVERDGFLPMWGTLWSFGDSIDEEWANGEHIGPHLQEMSDCGFRIYEQEDYGLIFGIDGCGYDFYEEHWIPLYKARGLHWHKEEESA